MAAAARSKQAVEAEKANNELISNLKLKVKDLEGEVSTLKGRLDDLRKAKNTTITKREREVIEVGFKRNPEYEAKLAEWEKKYKDGMAAKNKEIEELKSKHAEELEAALKKQKEIEKELEAMRKNLADLKEREMKQAQQGESAKTSAGKELAALRAKVLDLEGDNSALRMENTDLKDKINSLLSELSIKEAQWCETEEQYKLKIKQGWGDKYAEWMQETERKIQELQEANNILRMYLHRSGTRIPPEAGGDA